MKNNLLDEEVKDKELEELLKDIDEIMEIKQHIKDYLTKKFSVLISQI